jgi:hypothetical protein
MDRFLEKSERASVSMRAKDLVDMASSKEAAGRLELYSLELKKEFSSLQSDIEIFIKKSQLAGRDQKAVLKDLITMNETGEGFQDKLNKRLDSLQKSVLRREAAAAEIAEYRKVAGPNEKWQWITVSSSPCPDCKIRAGVTLSMQEWEEQGVPGSGATICNDNCKCKLIPLSVGEEMFPEVKQFDWNSTDGVLTTARDMRKFSADKNQPPQNEEL